jgi:excisionase family DNA binding protein
MTTKPQPAAEEIGRPGAYTIDDTRALLGGISRSGIYRGLDRGDLEAVRFGGRRLITAKSIDALLRRVA